MQQSQLSWIANFIWGIADDVLRDLYVRGKYRDVILPMTVLRRLDAVLEPTKQAVLEMKAALDQENNEEAGEHWTPRDAVKLMAKLIFLPIAGQIESGTYLLYDGACGTGGMLTVAEETLKELAAAQGKQVATHLYGQEINAETYAICKADLLLKGEGDAADNIVGGPEHSTLSNDAFRAREFDFMLSNPPYGKSWKSDLERMGGKGSIKDPRFVIEHEGDPEYSLLTRSSDGQMLFLANMLSKMKRATQWYRPLRKNLGKKNCELAEEDIGRICDVFLRFEESEQSRIFPNAALGYWKVTVERPLRLAGIDPGRVYARPRRSRRSRTAPSARMTRRRSLRRCIRRERRPIPCAGCLRPLSMASPPWWNTSQTPTCATRSISRCSKRAASRHSCAARCCRTRPTPGMIRPASRPATRSASRATSTSRSPCARWPRSAPTSWRWRRRRRGC